MKCDHKDQGIHVQVNGKDGAVQHDHSLEVIKESQSKKLLYSVNDVPPWYLCLILGFQVRIRFIFFIKKIYIFLHHTLLEYITPTIYLLMLFISYCAFSNVLVRKKPITSEVSCTFLDRPNIILLACYM